MILIIESIESLNLNQFFLIFFILKTKTVQVTAFETAQEIVNRCMHLFSLDNNQSSTNHHQSQSQFQQQEQSTSTMLNSNNSSSNSVYHLWLKTSQNEPLIPLIGKMTNKIKKNSISFSNFLSFLLHSS